MRLHDKVILVTGSTTGIGEAIARRAIAEGARVLVHGRDEERAAALVKELGDAAACHIDDIADPAAPPRIVGRGDQGVWPARCAGEQCRQRRSAATWTTPTRRCSTR